MPAPAAVNPFEEFADDPFTDVPDVDLEVEDLEDDAPVFTVVPSPPEEPVPPPAAPPTPVEDEEEREDLEGGGSYVIKKVNKGAGRKYQAQVTPVEGNVQYYYNDTKQGLLREVLKAQVHATAKIHQQEQRWKNAATKTGRELTAEEKAHANTLYQTDPVAATEYIREIETGVSKADKQAEANRVAAEAALNTYRSAAMQFFTARPLYDPTENNRFLLVNFMCQKYLGHDIQRTDAGMLDGENELLQKGFISGQNFCQAYDVLNSKGFLDLKTPTPTPPPPAAPEPPRIETTVKPQTPTPVVAPVIQRPKRVTGLKPSQGTVDPETSSTPTPADELDALDNLSDEQLRELTFGKGGFMHRLKNGET